MNHEECKRKALEPIVNYIESVMASYSKEELEARIKEALPELKESEDEKIIEWLIGIVNGCKELSFNDKVKLTHYLEKQKEQKPAKWSEKDKEMLEKCISHMINIIPVPGKHGLEDMSFEKHTDEELVIWFKSLPERFNLPPKQEWNEEDKDKVDVICKLIEHATIIPRSGDDDTGIPPTRLNDKYKGELKAFVKSLRPQPKEEREPMEIKYAGKIYKVYGTKELPGGVVGYIIEDEPGHYDCIIHPDEVLGGGYGIKSNGSPYPTKEATFGQPHWKPSEEQLRELRCVISGCSFETPILVELEEQLKKL